MANVSVGRYVRVDLDAWWPVGLERQKLTLYWSKNSIPALKGLTQKQRMELTNPVLGAVWRRWQVWLPVVVQLALAFLFIFKAPHFPYRLPIVIILAIVTVKIAHLPHNHYLALELNRLGAGNNL